jgi:hypothetical protein
MATGVPQNGSPALEGFIAIDPEKMFAKFMEL